MKLEVKENFLTKYEIILWENTNKFTAKTINYKSNRALIFIDKTVNNLYHKSLSNLFKKEDIDVTWIPVTSEEKNKNTEALFSVIDAIESFSPLRRQEPIIVIGGGILMDIVGFAASIYRRGIPYIRVPTTLLGMVDAGIGIKTGINYNQSKSRLGSYHPPLATYVMYDFLKTLPEAHLINGTAEILKMALVVDKRLFTLLQTYGSEAIKTAYQNTQNQAGKEIIQLSIEAMLDELKPNLLEKNLERKVDFGHTFSQLFEFCDSEPLLHGLAVNVDMALSITLAKNRNYLSEQAYSDVMQLMSDLSLPIWHHKMTTELCWSQLMDAVKHRDGQQNLPLPKNIGQCTFVNDLSKEELNQAIEQLKQYVDHRNK